MERRRWAGNSGIGVFVLAFVTTIVAFCSPGWLVSDINIRDSRLEQFGLWSHCFRTLPEPVDQFHHRFFLGCRWIYNPATTGYDPIRGYYLPPFLVATQVLFTLMLIAVLVNLFLIVALFLCSKPHQKHFAPLMKGIVALLLFAGICGLISIIVFGSLSDQDNWMAGRPRHYFGWGFAIAIIAVILCFIAAVLFLIELRLQRNERKRHENMDHMHSRTDITGDLKS